MEEEYTDIAPQTTQDKTYILNRYSMFMPVSARQIFYDYPELRKHKAFTNLTSSEVTFCWYMGHRSSPIAHWEDDARMAAFATDKSMITDKRRIVELKSLRFNEPIKKGIETMMSFRPNARIQALKMTDKMLENWKKIIAVDINMDNLSEEKIKIAKDYIASTKGIQKECKAIIEQTESAFSIHTNEEALEESEYTESFLDDWHSQKTKEKPQ